VQDWRDNATVVFTIITVIFLPLSFVASVFGMNTSDVRNMALTQWIFWASASSLTIMVVLITVYFVDVPPLWRWLERKSGAGPTAELRSPPTNHSKIHFLANLARHVEEKPGKDRKTGSTTQHAHESFPKDSMDGSSAA
jgi:uncharacterized membrane protein